MFGSGILCPVMPLRSPTGRALVPAKVSYMERERARPPPERWVTGAKFSATAGGLDTGFVESASIRAKSSLSDVPLYWFPLDSSMGAAGDGIERLGKDEEAPATTLFPPRSSVLMNPRPNGLRRCTSAGCTCGRAPSRALCPMLERKLPLAFEFERANGLLAAVFAARLKEAVEEDCWSTAAIVSACSIPAAFKV